MFLQSKKAKAAEFNPMQFYHLASPRLLERLETKGSLTHEVGSAIGELDDSRWIATLFSSNAESALTQEWRDALAEWLNVHICAIALQLESPALPTPVRYFAGAVSAEDLDFELKTQEAWFEIDRALHIRLWRFQRRNQ